MVSIVFRAELTAVDQPAAVSFAKREPRPRALGGVSGTLMYGFWRDCWRAPLGKHMGAPQVPHGTSGTSLTGHTFLEACGALRSEERRVGKESRCGSTRE